MVPLSRLYLLTFGQFLLEMVKPKGSHTNGTPSRYRHVISSLQTLAIEWQTGSARYLSTLASLVRKNMQYGTIEIGTPRTLN